MQKAEDQIQQEVFYYAQKFKTLAHPVRLQIVLFLRDGEKCVCDISKYLQMSQSKISYHLKLLLDVRLIQQRLERTWSYYSLREDVISWINEDCCEIFKLKKSH